MANGYFEIFGLDELRDDVKKLLQDYPSETEAELEKCSNDFKKDVNKKFPHGGKDTTKPVAKSWKKSKLTDAMTGMTQGVSLKNTAPHFHLVENGHEMVISPEQYKILKQSNSRFSTKAKNRTTGNKAKSRKTNMIHKGFIQGKHYCEKTRNEWNNGEFAARVEKHVDKLLKKHNL